MDMFKSCKRDYCRLMLLIQYNLVNLLTCMFIFEDKYFHVEEHVGFTQEVIYVHVFTYSMYGVTKCRAHGLNILDLPSNG